MGKTVRLEMKHVRYVRGKPQVRVRVPDDLRPVLGMKERTQFVPEGNTRDMKDAVAEIVGAIKASFRKLRDEQAPIAWEYYTPKPNPYHSFGGGQRLARRPVGSAPARDSIDDETPEPVKFETVLERWSIGKSEKEDQNTRREAERFTAFVGYDDMRRVSRKEAVAYKDHLVDMVRDEEIASKTGDNQLKRVKAVFSYALANDKIESNPFDKVRFDIAVESEQREDFTTDELRRALAAARPEKNPMLKWFQFLGVFTGCRDSELTRGHKDSVRQIEGVWCFCVLKKYGLKTANSERTIPLHPAIIEAGFLTYIASLPEGSTLFPGYTEHNIFYDLAAFYDRLGIAKRFYSLRHTVTTHFRFRTDIDGDVKNYLMAHGKKDAHAKYGRYPADKLLPAIETILVP
jgi:integrase